MRGAFDFLDQPANAVVIQPGTDAHRLGMDLEWPILLRPALGQPSAQKLVHGFFEGPPGAASFALQLRSYIFVKRQSGPHIMMLT